MIIDISGPLFPGMWSYADLPQFRDTMSRFALERQTEIGDQGFESHRFSLDTHTGTYLETSAHLVPGGRRLDSLAAGDLVLPAWVLRIPPVEPRGWITAEALERSAPPLRAGDALLIDSGWGSRWNGAGYVTEAPAFHPDCTEWLRTVDCRLLGVDVPSIDSPREGEPGTRILAHLFERDGLLLAPVRLHELSDALLYDRLELVVAPLPLQRVSAAPCRALVRDLRTGR
jgi:arylformamidase